MASWQHRARIEEASAWHNLLEQAHRCIIDLHLISISPATSAHA
jgi:hypothetical protein